MTDLNEVLKPFLSLHPNSRLEEASTDEGTQFELVRPWDDDSIKLVFPPDPEALADALNHITLNYRFSAIYHNDLKAIEVIWTPFPLEDIADIDNRAFSFEFEGGSYTCRFARSSDRLLLLARHYEQVKFSETQTRNLDSYRLCLEGEDDMPFEPKYRSFWLGEIQSFDEDSIVRLVSNLNFYMTYFDWLSPMIIVHPPYRPKNSEITYVRYIDGKFPETVIGRAMDDNLLHFWLAAKAGDQSRRFIYYFRILEYCSSLYVDHATRLALKKILLLPNSIDNISYTEEKLISVVKQYTRKDRDTMQAMLLELLDVNDLWPHLAQNRLSFTVSMEFDGGFSIKPLINESCKSADDWHNGVQNFCAHINNIRNALSHGQDQRTSLPILPTHGNFEKIRPWVTLISAAAAKVMILRGGL